VEEEMGMLEDENGEVVDYSMKDVEVEAGTQCALAAVERVLAVDSSRAVVIVIATVAVQGGRVKVVDSMENSVVYMPGIEAERSERGVERIAVAVKERIVVLAMNEELCMAVRVLFLVVLTPSPHLAFFALDIRLGGAIPSMVSLQAASQS
jgi:hypothetical protein